MINAYYRDDYVTIYNGDARELVADLPVVDALISDPPYGCKRPSQRTGKVKDIQGNKAVDTQWLDNVRINDDGAAYVFTAWEVMEQWRQAMAKRWTVRSCIVWDKGAHGMADLKTCWAPRHELCLFASAGRHELSGKRPVDVLRVMRQNYTDHPYEKPVELISRFIAASNPQSILDPFAGSGSTLVAAKLENRKAIGIEIEEKYCEIAANRLCQGVLDFGVG